MGPETLEQILSTFLEGAQGGIGVLTGSLPVGVPVEIYGDLVARLREREALAVVDAKGPMLAHALPHQPFLIKPNRYELEMLCGNKLPSLSAVVKEGRRLQQQGVTYICVSLGGEGAIQVGPRDIYHVKVPQVQVRSTVGAGDSLVGGLVAAFARGQVPVDALRLGICCGSGTAQKPGTELFTREDIEKLTKSVEVHRLEI